MSVELLGPPRSRVLPLALILGGVVVAVLLLFLPLKASFADDPVLRLTGFDRQGPFEATEVDCGPAPANVGEPIGTGSFYDIARNDACHRVGYRRFWVATATGAMLMAGGLAGLVAMEREE